MAKKSPKKAAKKVMGKKDMKRTRAGGKSVLTTRKAGKDQQEYL